MYLPESDLEEFLEHVGDDHRGILRVLTKGEFGVWYESARDDAFVVSLDGRRYVCPRYPRLRMLEGLIAFRNSYPGATASLLVPDQMADRAADELTEMQRATDARSHILTSPFYVPLRWFAAFDQAERSMTETEEGPELHYWTSAAAAKERLERALEILDAVGFDDPVVGQVRDVFEWVKQFSDDALLELDYGGVVHLFAPADLALDESAADVAEALDALEQGDFDQATEHYGRVAERWSHAQSLTYAN